jgi:transposase
MQKILAVDRLPQAVVVLDEGGDEFMQAGLKNVLCRCIREPRHHLMQWILLNLTHTTPPEHSKIDHDIGSDPSEPRLAGGLLESVPGIGKATTLVLVAELPNSARSRQIAALAGVAPLILSSSKDNHDSGKKAGRRAIAGGRPGVRAALYKAALVASRCNLVIAPHYQKLRAAGKPASRP